MKFILMILLFSIPCLAITSYKKDALPIFTNRCNLCHNADMMPDKNWSIYKQAKAKKKLIKDRVWIIRDMPQGNVTNMTDKEREVIKKWVDEGAKE